MLEDTEISQLSHPEEVQAEKSGSGWPDPRLRAQRSIRLSGKLLVSLLREERSHWKFGSTSHEFPGWLVLIVSRRLDSAEDSCNFYPQATDALLSLYYFPSSQPPVRPTPEVQTETELHTSHSSLGCPICSSLTTAGV